MEKENVFMKMDLSMLVNGLEIRNMEKASKSIKMGLCMLANGLIISNMVMAIIMINIQISIKLATNQLSINQLNMLDTL